MTRSEFLQDNLSKAHLPRPQIGTIGPVVKVDDPKKMLGAASDHNRYSDCNHYYYPLLRKPWVSRGLTLPPSFRKSQRNPSSTPGRSPGWFCPLHGEPKTMLREDLKKKKLFGTCLVIQWLRLHMSTPGG